jgi:hypothetical protein
MQTIQERINFCELLFSHNEINVLVAYELFFNNLNDFPISDFEYNNTKEIENEDGTFSTINEKVNITFTKNVRGLYLLNKFTRFNCTGILVEKIVKYESKDMFNPQNSVILPTSSYIFQKRFHSNKNINFPKVIINNFCIAYTSNNFINTGINRSSIVAYKNINDLLENQTYKIKTIIVHKDIF